jgi:hypothetical protein
MIQDELRSSSSSAAKWMGKLAVSEKQLSATGTLTGDALKGSFTGSGNTAR